MTYNHLFSRLFNGALCVRGTVGIKAKSIHAFSSKLERRCGISTYTPPHPKPWCSPCFIFPFIHPSLHLSWSFLSIGDRPIHLSTLYPAPTQAHVCAHTLMGIWTKRWDTETSPGKQTLITLAVSVEKKQNKTKHDGLIAIKRGLTLRWDSKEAQVWREGGWSGK